MPSTYTTRNRGEKQGPGENNNNWGTLLNTNTIDMIDEALDGYLALTVSGSVTLTTANGSTDQARRRYINMTGTGGTVTIPNAEKVYIVRNATSGTVTFTTGSGTTCTLPTLTQGIVVCEAGNVCRSFVIQPYGANLATLSALSSVANLSTLANLASVANLSTLAGLASVANLSAEAGLTGAADKLDYYTGVGTKALTSFTAAGRTLVGGADAAAQRTSLGLGALAVLATINGGNWSGTDLGVLDGGTGASTAAGALTNLGAQTALTFSSNASGSCISLVIGATTYKLQFGSVAVGANASVAVTFPTAYTAAPIVVGGGGSNSAATVDEARIATATITTTGFTVTNPSSAGTANWVAIGA